MHGAVHSRRKRSHKNLVARSHPARTFASLLTFLALMFLCFGVYLIAEPLMHPVAALDIGVIAGAFSSALGCILLFYVVKPGPAHRAVPESRQATPAHPREPLYSGTMTLHPAERTRVAAAGVSASAESRAK
jgi:hypothetical protein